MFEDGKKIMKYEDWKSEMVRIVYMSTTIILPGYSFDSELALQ